MIRVIIERHIKAGKRGDFIDLLNKLRADVVNQPGFISGETLTSIEDSFIISVLSTWRSLEDWKAWEGAQKRVSVEQKIEPLLMKLPKVRIYQVMAAE